MPVVIERTLNATAERVWKAITDVNEMRNWFFDLPAFDAVPGFEFTFSGNNEDRTYLHSCRIIEVKRNEKLSYTWQYPGYEGSSVVSFELIPDGEQTMVRLTHSGLHTFPRNNPDFDKMNFAEGWNQIIGFGLKNYLDKK
jgi:uncharacterized protein YndB with AHSA1/START domain